MSENVHPTTTGPHFIISTEDGAIHGQESPENLEIVRRIEVCMKACEGISTEDLESGIIQDMRRVLAEVVPVLQEKVSANRQAAPVQSISIENRVSA